MTALSTAFLREATLLPERVESFDRYPFSIPALRKLGSLELHPSVTFLVGENGTGKSTLVEAIAVCVGFNAEGGSANLKFSTRSSESELHKALRIVRGTKRPKTGFFLRAESFFNVASEVEKDPVILANYGGVSLHEKSHGESFLTLVQERFAPDGLYILDEPEAALSPQRQLALLAHVHRLEATGRSQFLIATHSPILLGYPNAWIYELSVEGVHRVEYEETEHYRITHDFLNHRERYLEQILAEEEPE